MPATLEKPATPAAAPTAPPAKPADKPQPTLEERMKGVEFAFGEGAQTQPPAPAAPATEKTGKEGDVEKAATEKAAADAAAKAAAKPAPAKVVPAKRVIRAKGYEDAPKVGDAATKLATAAEKLGEAANKIAATRKEPAAPAEPKLDLTPKEQRQLKVFEAMGEMDKGRFGHLATAAKSFLAALPVEEPKWTEKFTADWERKNPETAFDTPAERDVAFAQAKEAAYPTFVAGLRSKHKFEYEQDDYEEGLLFARDKPITEQLTKAQKELEALRSEQKKREAEPIAKEFGLSAVGDVAEQLGKKVGEEFAGVIKDDGTIDDKKIDALDYGDILKPTFEAAAAHAKTFGEATALLFSGQDSPHGESVYRWALRFEQSMAEKPEEESMEDGKAFVPLLEYRKMSEAEKAKHWSVTPEHLTAFYNDKLLDSAKEVIGEERKKAKIIEERALKKAGVKATATPAAEAETAATRKVKPESPTSTEAAPVIPKGEDASDFLMKHLRGRA